MDRPKLSIRSTKGCWTCRLRKKKCDEIRPGCERCASVNIECHYGPKPPWIEDPELGKEELARVKAVVSVVANRKRAEHRARARVAGPLAKSYPSPSSPRPLQTGETTPWASTSGNSVASIDNAVVQKYSGLSSDASWLSNWIKDQEANLIMHYLDNVFYIQFQFHTPVVAEGGRGWILSLLTRTKPLYHAALSISAFHQQSLMLPAQGEGKTEILLELERQHNLTLKELQVFIQAENLTNHSEAAFERNIQILACVVELISFELFNGGRSNWQLHLKAATEIVLILNDTKQPNNQHSEIAQIITRDSPIRAGIKFLISCIVYFDTLATVSTGQRANLADHHHRLVLGPDPAAGHFLELHTAFGCHNWCILLISEISTLAFQRNDWRTVVADNVTFENSARDIETRLLNHHRDALQELHAFREIYGKPPPHAMRDAYVKHINMLVTCIFSSAAIIYLHTAKTSEVAPATIQSAIEDAKQMFMLVPAPRMLRALVWPLCVVGCMASTVNDQDFFRKLVMSAVEDSRTSGNSAEVLSILERSWQLQQQTGHLVDCAATIRETANCILLV